MATRRSLGWIGIAIVGLGAAIAALGIWFFVKNHPEPGAVIDEIAIDADTKLVVRAEDGGPRSFVVHAAGGNEHMISRSTSSPTFEAISCSHCRGHLAGSGSSRGAAVRSSPVQSRRIQKHT